MKPLRTFGSRKTRKPSSLANAAGEMYELLKLLAKKCPSRSIQDREERKRIAANLIIENRQLVIDLLAKIDGGYYDR